MSHRTAALLILLAALGACSPALNWRSVQHGPVTVLLPCKPDRAQRQVPIGTQMRTMDVVGCEAAGALFAVSRLEIPSDMDRNTLQTQWHAAAMASLGDAQKSQGQVVPAAMLAASGVGKRPDGSTMQARFLWQTGTQNMVLLAVYAPNITAEMTEPFLVEFKLP